MIFRVRILAALLVAQPLAALAEGGRLTVVTALLATHSITATLAEGTAIDVVILPSTPAAMGALARSLTRAEAEVAPVLAGADAVVTLRSVWPADPLFQMARAANIRVVEIDAAFPIGGERPGVGLLPQPVSDAPWLQAEQVTAGRSPYVWLSISNGQRMSEIVAEDLSRLSPADAATIRDNLAAFKAKLGALKAEYDDKFLTLPDVSVFALSDRLDYLLTDMGLFVDGRFLEPGIRWQEADHAGFVQTLLGQGPRVVVHHWEPEAPVLADIDAALARLVVLDSGDPAPKVATAGSYLALLAANLDALHRALSGTGR